MAAIAPLGALFGGASAPLSYAGMAIRSIPFISRPLHLGSWKENDSVVLKQLECHLPGEERVEGL